MREKEIDCDGYLFAEWRKILKDTGTLDLTTNPNYYGSGFPVKIVDATKWAELMPKIIKYMSWGMHDCRDETTATEVHETIEALQKLMLE